MSTKYEKIYPISVKEATYQGIISKEWNRAYRRYFWYASGGSSGGWDTALEALAEYYNAVLPLRKKEEIEIAQNKLNNDVGFPAYMDIANDIVEFINPITNNIEILSIRKFRQIVFDLEDASNKEVIYIDKPLTRR